MKLWDAFLLKKKKNLKLKLKKKQQQQVIYKFLEAATAAPPKLGWSPNMSNGKPMERERERNRLLQLHEKSLHRESVKDGPTSLPICESAKHF